MSRLNEKAYVSLYCKIYAENFSNEMIDRYATGKEIYNFLLRDAECCLPLKGDCNLWYLGCNEKFGSIIYKERIWNWNYGESSFDRVQEFIDSVYQDGLFTKKQYEQLSDKIQEGKIINDMYLIPDYLRMKNKPLTTTAKEKRMSYKILHFRHSEKILKDKKMTREVKDLMEYVHDCLYGTCHKSELLRQALTEMNWRQNGDLNVLDGRRYFYKGFRNRIAIDGSFSSYEYIQDALLRLQVGFDKGKIDMGIVMITAQRSENSRLGSTEALVGQEIEMLHPTISLPVMIVLFDLGRPGELYPGNEQTKDNELPDDSAIDPRLSDQYLHGDRAGKPESGDEVYSNTEEQAFHEAQKSKRKPRAKSKKPAVPDQRQAA
jgi:hypothetical protein